MYEENGIIYNSEYKTIVKGYNIEKISDSNIVLPPSVKKIARKAFANIYAPDATFTIPDSVNFIEESAFEYASFKKVIIEEGPYVIDRGAFLASDVPEFVLPKSVKKIEAKAFIYSNVKKINLENIEYYATASFYQTGLESLTLNKNVEGIEEKAFSHCTSLKYVFYGPSILYIPADCFYLSGVETFEFGSDTEIIGDSAFASSRLKNITFPNSLSTIGNAAFENTLLENISIPSSVTSIGNFAFSNCDHLKQITIEEGTTPLSLKKCCFATNKKLKNMIIPARVNSMDSEILSDCPNIETISVYANTNNLPGAFANNCTNLKNIYLAPNIKHLEFQCFAATGLEEVNENFKNIESFRESAFKDCKNLSKAVFYPNANNPKAPLIGPKIFEGCDNLKNIFILGNLPAFTNAFSKINSDVVVYAPEYKPSDFNKDSASHICTDKKLMEEEIVDMFPFRKASKIIEEIER